MSTRLKSEQGHLIRIPNAVVFKKEVINTTYFTHAALELSLQVTYATYL